MVEHGDRAALIERNLPLVQHVVYQVAVHFPRHVDRGELARAGALGLVEAAQRYDAARGVPFERFAAQRIRGAILDTLRAADWAPRSVRNVGRRIDSTSQDLTSELGRQPSNEELAEALGMTPDRLARLQSRVHRAVVLALDHFVADSEDEDNLTLVDVLCDRSTPEPSEELEGRELLSYLRDAVGLLPERHRLVVVGYFLEGRTSLELARLLGVTESRISQIRSEALELLREGIEAQYGDARPVAPPAGGGRAARRKAGFAASIARSSGWRSRLDATAFATANDVPAPAASVANV